MSSEVEFRTSLGASWIPQRILQFAWRVRHLVGHNRPNTDLVARMRNGLGVVINVIDRCATALELLDDSQKV